MPRRNVDEHLRLQTDVRFRGKAAVLTLTTERLVIARMSRVPPHRETTLVSIPLEAVVGVRRRSEDGREVLALATSGVEHSGPDRVEIETENPLGLRTAIESQADTRKEFLRSQREAGKSSPTPSIHVTMHRAQPPAPPAVVYVRCSHCRTVYPELDAKCPSCGAPF